MDGNQDFPFTLMEIQTRTIRLSLFTVLQVILYDLKSCAETIAVVVGVDELNKVYDIDHYAFKEIVNQVDRASCGGGCPAQIFFVPVLAGTIEGPLSEVITQPMHEALPLPLQFLLESNAFEIAKQINFDQTYINHNLFFR